MLAALFVLVENLLSLWLLDCDHSQEALNGTAQDQCAEDLEQYWRASPLVVMVVVSLFFFVGFCLKSVLFAVYLTVVYVTQESSDVTLSPRLYWFCICVALCLHFRDRYLERTSRSHFLWKSKLAVEQNDVEVMGGINKILLENILPEHVAQHFLSSRLTDTLYHER